MTIIRSISMSAPQLDWLKGEAGRLGISVSDLVRRIIDKHREQQDSRKAA
jgi:hypothetical protein